MAKGPRTADFLDKIDALQLTAMIATGSLLIFYYGCWTSDKNKKKSPPFATTTLWQTIKALTGTKLHTFLTEQIQATGSTLFRLSITGVVAVANSDDARAICQDSTTKKPSALYKGLDSFTGGPNIVTIADNGHSWHHRRKGINPAFGPKYIRKMNEIARLKVNEWIENKLLRWVENGQSFDVAAEMIAITISVICKAAFLYDISDQEAKSLSQMMQDCFEEFNFKTSLNPLRKLATFLLQDRRDAFRQATVLQNFAYKMLDLYRLNHAKTATLTDPCVIGLIVANENYKNDNERISDILTFLVAGHDTTGYAAAFALWELAKCPEEQRKLRHELVQPGNKQGSNRRPYLNCVITETMRLRSPAVVSGFKELGHDFVSKDGYYLPKGTIALIAHGAFGQDPLLYPDPSSFQPSRWVDPFASAMSAQFPFSLGKRNCVGQALALAEMETFLSVLVPKFQFVVDEEGTIETRAILRLKGCRLKAIKMSSSS